MCNNYRQTGYALEDLMGHPLNNKILSGSQNRVAYQVRTSSKLMKFCLQRH